MNETTSTSAAAQPNSHWGSGRSARWTIPCACAAAGRERRGEDHAHGGDDAAAREPQSAVWMADSKAFHADRALQAGGDLARLVDGEQPRLGLQVEILERLAQPLVGVVALVDLLVDEGHPVAVLGLHLRRDVGDGPAHARLAQLRRREQQRDRLRADGARPGRRACRSSAARVSIASRSPLADATVSVLTFGACSPTSGIVSCAALDTLIWPALRPACRRRRYGHHGLRPACRTDVRRVDRGERIGLRRRLLGAVGPSVTSTSAGARYGPLRAVGRRAT